MGLFNNLMSKIFGHAAPAAAKGPQTAAAAPTTGGVEAAGATAQPAAASAPAVVDVAAVLNDMAGKNPENLDWRKSIVDLMKLVGMDSSLWAPKQPATEMDYRSEQ